VQAMSFPSGETRGQLTPLPRRCAGLPPSIEMRLSAPRSSLPDLYTTHLPSGETCGCELLPSDVNCLISLPSMLARQLSELPLRSDRKTIYRPSAVTVN